MTKWFEQKEQQAGVKRLILTWEIYKHFGIIPVRLIAFSVALIAYIAGGNPKRASKKYFQVLSEYTQDKALRPSFWNLFKHFYSYADSLVDKMLAFSGNLSPEKFEYADIDVKNEMFDILKNGQGVFFLSSHTGNVEIMRSLFFLEDYSVKPNVNVFLQKASCEIFNGFLNYIKVKIPVEVFPVEDISVDTAVTLNEKLNQGEIVFMAGDRLSAQFPELAYETELFNRKVQFPLGALKFAQILECPVYFVVCAKENDKFKIHLRKFEANGTKKEVFKELQRGYKSFIEECTLKYPYQFYNFYELFS